MVVKNSKDWLYYFIRDKRRKLIFAHTKYYIGFSFIHINKTGGSSIEHALRVPLIHETAITFRNHIGEARWEKRFSFSIVRNPWDRLWSEYNFFWEHICSWDEFFEYFPHHIFDDHKTGRDALRHIKPQNEFITPEVEVLRFENLTTEFADFCERHGLPNRGLPSKTNASNAVGYRDMYDATKIQAVRNFYSEDIELFGYDI